MKAIVSLLLLFSVSVSLHAAEKVAEVTAQELLKHPQLYSGKRLIVTGYWGLGFEWSNLCADSAHPFDDISIWVQSWNNSDSSDAIIAAEKRELEIRLKAQKAANLEPHTSTELYWIRCEGLFEHRTGKEKITRGGFGHMGTYKSQFIISRVIEIKALKPPESYLRK